MADFWRVDLRKEETGGLRSQLGGRGDKGLNEGGCGGKAKKGPDVDDFVAIERATLSEVWCDGE